MQIQYIAIDEISEYENNPRKNEKAIEAVQNSIASFGFKVPIVLDENKMIIAGHTRLKAAQKLGLDVVPCIIANDLTPEKVRAYRIADNKTAEIADWDFEKLEQELADISAFDIDMSEFGFDETVFDVMTDNDIDIDEAIAEGEGDAPITKRGDIWQLGAHRLICGDSTDADTIAALMDGVKADLLLTDPPYNVAYKGATSDKLTIKNDDMPDKDFDYFLIKAFSAADRNLAAGGAFYIWHADSAGLSFRSACEAVDWNIRQCLIWCKNTFVMGRQDYQWRHEPCLYGWKDGAPHYFIDNRKQSTILEYDKPLRNGEHPTMKPIELFARLILNSTRRGGIVLDPFGGSGTTLIACENQNRVCYMCELDEVYCDVIIKRWEQLTGGKAIKFREKITT